MSVGPRAVLHVHQDDVRTAFMQRLDAFLERGPETVGLDPANGIDGTRLPYHQIGLLVDQQFRHALGQILGGLPAADQGHDLDRDAGMRFLSAASSRAG